MNELKIKESTISSLEVAEMLGIDHYKLIRKLEGSNDRKGYTQILNDAQMGVVDYFIKDSYKDAKGEENKCYKFTGEKGIIFLEKFEKKY